MAGFRYGMQNILSIKEKMETQARQELALAKEALEREEERLFALTCRKEELQKEGTLLRRGSLKLVEIRENRDGILMCEERIRDQIRRRGEAARAMEEAREHLERLMKERKMHESLKNRAFEAYLQEENRRESKTIDELTSYTYGQKRQEK